MITQFDATKPKEIKFDLLATATLADWIEIKGQLSKSEASYHGPCRTLARDIEDLVNQAQQVYTADFREDDTDES